MDNINVKNLLGRPDLDGVDGETLASQVVRQLQSQTGDVILDFSKITSITPSAASRLFHRINLSTPGAASNRLVFINAAPWVLERLEDTAMYQNTH